MGIKENEVRNLIKITDLSVEEIDELIGIANDILADPEAYIDICHGKIMGIVHAEKTTKEELGLMMTGSLDLTEEKKGKNYGIAKDSNLSEEEWEKMREQEESLKEKENSD